MSVTRNDAGEVRLAWRLILVILLYVAVAVLLRIIPVALLTASWTRDGMTRANALERASAFISEDPVYSTAIGVLSGLMGFLIVWFMVRVIEGSGFSWKAVRLDWRGSSLPAMILGALLALLLFGATVLTGSVLGPPGSSLESPVLRVCIPVFLQKLVLYIAMGFGEEVVFRGYVQTRLVDRHRAIWGILIAAVIFVLLHQISYRPSPVIVLSGVMLWTTVGALYHLSKSLYLVCMFHGVTNTLLNTLHSEAGNVSGVVVHALTLLLIILFALARSRGSHIRSNPA
jgi:membrane protease YdiL (CAAX protease family)